MVEPVQSTSSIQQYKYNIIQQYNKNELLEQKQPELLYSNELHQEQQIKDHTILNLHNNNSNDEIVNNNYTISNQSKWWFLNFNIIARLFQS